MKRFALLSMQLSYYATTILLASCQSAPNSPLYTHSDTRLDFDYHSDEPFGVYLARVDELLQRQRVFHSQTPDDRDTEFQRVKPFQQELPTQCTEAVTHGVLLLHGVLDTPFAMRDIAEALAQRCIASRAILLPGHGTRPADMLNIRWTDWTEATQYAVRSLHRNYKKVSIVGFSLGGLIALHTASTTDEIHRIVALSPALHVAYPSLVWHSQWLRHFIDWMDIDPYKLSVRYPSTTTNGIAEIYSLSKVVQGEIKDNGLKTPALVIQSQDEITIDPNANREFMQHHMGPQHRLVEYGSLQIPMRNHELRKSHYPEYQVLNFSHVTLPYRPENPVFGLLGSHKECGENIGLVDAVQAQQCLANAINWKGEVGSTKEEKYLPVQRLTFNPDFEQMIAAIANWITESDQI